MNTQFAADTGGMYLSELCSGYIAVEPSLDRMVTAISLDSREVRPGGLFLACLGGTQHGLNFLPEALAAGAAAVIYDPENAPTVIGEIKQIRIPILPVPKLTAITSHIAGRFYNDPSRDMTLIGVTGTNGKTSTAQFLAQSLSSDLRCGQIGTLGSGFPGALTPSMHTTPDPVKLQAILADLSAEGAEAVAMEVSSHALDQQRVEGLFFNIAVLTNLTQDHLDYHGDMNGYAQAKGRLFHMPGLSWAVINLDDPFGESVLEKLPQDVIPVGYGLDFNGIRLPEHWVKVTDIQPDVDGMRITIESSWGDGQFISSLLGRFNASNLGAVLSVLLLRGVPLDDALQRLSALETVPGRMERLGSGEQPHVVVDYAHTPDALEQALKALRPHVEKRLIVLFGCGGDRDKGKRPLMGAIAERLSDLVIVTDDNPRTEDGNRIVEEILTGMQKPDSVVIQRNRAEAISAAVLGAGTGDLVLIAGKGDETVQQIGRRKLLFSDREQARSALAQTVSFPRYGN